jgi:predicted phosphodiesterase
MLPPTLPPKTTLSHLGSDSTNVSYKEYFDSIDGLLASLTLPHALDFAETSKVWCVSDLHVDCAENQEWLRALNPQPHDAVIVAGDLCTSLKKLRAALIMIQAKFKHVFFVPGNHELWTYRGGPNSLQKFYQILKLCSEIGVHVEPALLGDRVAVVPMYGWWCFAASDVAEADETTALPSQHEVASSFDAMCMWPSSVGDPENPHNSSYDRIAAFFLSLNQRALNTNFAGRDIVSFGHFLPDACHCSETPELASILCCPPTGKQIKGLGSCVHIFGHSHTNTDVIIDGTRFIQNALGHSKDKGQFNSNTVLVQAWPHPTSGLASGVECLKMDRSARLKPIERKTY